MRYIWLLSFVILGLAGHTVKEFSQPSCIKKPREAYYLNTGRYPDGPVSFGEHKLEVQGLAHCDKDNPKFIVTATKRNDLLSIAFDGFEVADAFLFKIPITEDLQHVDVFGTKKVEYKSLWNYTALWYPDKKMSKTLRMLNGYTHWGDPDVYVHNDKEYLIVPMTSPSKKKAKLSWGHPAIAIFRASDLSLISYGLLPDARGNGLKDVGWCAVNPKTGAIYTSTDDTDSLLQYEIPWVVLTLPGYKGEFGVNLKKIYKIKDAKNDDLPLTNMQGGVFSNNGDLLYISNGAGRCIKGPDNAGRPSDGLHVFDTLTWKEIRHSYNRLYYKPGESNCCRPFKDPFDFTYDFRCGWLEYHSMQPEGIDILNVDKYKHYKGLYGQLHVLGASVGAFGNQAWMDHYTNLIYIDKDKGKPASWPTDKGGVDGFFDEHSFSGTRQRPFKTFGDALYFYPTWEGAQFVLKTPDNDKPSILTTEGGLVGYLIVGVPVMITQGKTLPPVSLFLCNYTSKTVSKLIEVNFYLSKNPINPVATASSFVKMGSFRTMINIKSHSAKSYTITGLVSPVYGTYYMGTNINCGPISSPAHPIYVKIRKAPYPGNYLKESLESTVVADTSIPWERGFLPDISFLNSMTDTTETEQKSSAPVVKAFDSHQLKVYPNPARSTLTVEFYSTTKSNYAMWFIDLLGRSQLVKRGIADKGVNTIQVDIGLLRKGMYVLNLSTTNLQTTTKVLIE